MKVAPAGKPDAVNVTVLDGSESVTFTLNLRLEPDVTRAEVGVLSAGAGVTSTETVIGCSSWWPRRSVKVAFTPI